MQDLDDYSLLRLRDVEESKLRQSVWRDASPTNTSIFYSQRWNRFFVHDLGAITMLSRGEVTKLGLQVRVPIESMSYNDELKALCYNTVSEPNILCVYWIKSNTENVVKANKGCSVLFFDWMYTTKGATDLFAVESGGVRMYKAEEDRKTNLHTIKEAKFLSLKVSACWFEPINEVLACCSFSESGAIHMFHFNDKKGKNNYKGVSLVLDFEETGSHEPARESTLDYIIKKTKSASKQLKFRVESTPQNKALFHRQNPPEQYYIQLGHIYGRSCLLFFNTAEGRLKIYHLLEDQIVKVNLQIRLPSDTNVVFCIYDNLLVTHLKFDRISFIFDIKRNSSQPVATPQPITFKAPADKLNPYESVFLNRYIVHPSRLIKKWELNLEQIFKFLKNQNQLFLFLVRRRNSKMLVLKWLRDNMMTFKVTSLSSFWKMLFDQFQASSKSDDKVRVEQAISPTQIYANVFFPLAEDQNYLPQHSLRLTDVLIECVRQMIEFKLEIPLRLQSLLCNLLLTQGRELLLYQLIQIRVLEDTKDLADLLFVESQARKSRGQETSGAVLEQVALDIYYRKEMYRELIETFAKLGSIAQIARVLKKSPTKYQLEFFVGVNRIVVAQQRERLVRLVKQYARDNYPTIADSTIQSQLANAVLTA